MSLTLKRLVSILEICLFKSRYFKTLLFLGLRISISEEPLTKIKSCLFAQRAPFSLEGLLNILLVLNVILLKGKV